MEKKYYKHICRNCGWKWIDDKMFPLKDCDNCGCSSVCDERINKEKQ